MISTPPPNLPGTSADPSTISRYEIWEQLLAEQPLPDVTATRFGWEVWSSICLPRQYRTVIAFLGNHPVALTPLVERREGPAKLCARVLTSAGDDHWHCGYVITGRQVEVGVQALLAQLVDARDWDVLQLGPMLADSPVRDALIHVGRDMGLRPLVDRLDQAPCVTFNGTWEGYYRTRSSNLQTSIRKKERRLAADGNLALEDYRSGADLERKLNIFFAIEGSGWKGEAGTAIAQDVQLRRFYTELARAASERSTLRLYLLSVGNRFIAAEYCIKHGDVIYFLKTGYNAEYSKFSPGEILHKRIFQHIVSSQDAATCDLGPGGGEHSGHKHRWANGARDYEQIRLFHPRSPRGTAAATLLWLKRRIAVRNLTVKP